MQKSPYTPKVPEAANHKTKLGVHNGGLLIVIVVGVIVAKKPNMVTE